MCIRDRPLRPYRYDFVTLPNLLLPPPLTALDVNLNLGRLCRLWEDGVALGFNERSCTPVSGVTGLSKTLTMLSQPLRSQGGQEPRGQLGQLIIFGVFIIISFCFIS